MMSRRSPCSPVAASVHLPAGPFGESWSRTNIERPGVIVDITNQPIPPLALAVGEVVTAHRLGLAREAMCQFGGIAGHHAASRSAMRSIGYRSSTFARTSTPPASVGTNMRSFQEMISLNEPVRPEPIAHGVGESGQIDAVRAHDADAAKLEAFGEVEDSSPFHQRGKRRVRRQLGRVSRKDVCHPGGRNLATDDAFAGIGLKPIDPRRTRPAVASRSAAASRRRYGWCFREFGHVWSSASQAARKRSRSTSTQWLSAIIFKGRLICSVGRISRTRRSISPSSSIKLGAGTVTAARPERSLTNSTPEDLRTDRAPLPASRDDCAVVRCRRRR